MESRIVDIRGRKMLLDSDVAALYGVETKRVNEAVKNNPDKFSEGYILELDSEETKCLRSKFSTLNIGCGEHTKYKARAFTEKGLYMLATILKSERATRTIIAIVETFTKIRELSRTVAELSNTSDQYAHRNLIIRYRGRRNPNSCICV